MTVFISDSDHFSFFDDGERYAITTPRAPKPIADQVVGFVSLITTDEYWDIDGVPMNTPAWNIELIDPAVGVPTKRGSNFVVPFADGEVWREKRHSSVTRSLVMWLSWKDQNGVEASTRAGRKAQYLANEDYIKKMFLANPSIQHTVTRRVLNSDGSLSIRSFVGEAINAVQFQYAENDYYPSCGFVIDWLCADPYWYGLVDSFVVGPPAAPTNQSKITHVLAGTREATKMTLKFVGPLVNPQLSNLSYLPDITLLYAGTLTTGQTVTLDTLLFSAVNQLGTSVLSSVTRYNSREWFRMLAGENILRLSTDSAGSGEVDITVQPVYL